MSDYINRDELLKIRPFTCYMGLSVSEYDEGFLDCADEAREAIKNLPAADVAEVKHGNWEIKTVREEPQLYCSECGDSPGILYEYKFCPHCGVKMDLED